MFIDASALVAIIAGESDGETLARQLDAAEERYTAPISMYETTLALLRVRRTNFVAVSGLLGGFVTRSHIQIVPITAEIGGLAIDAFERFGRGRHPAALNMGDCFAYACARSLGVPLLFKGEDFAKTDIRVARAPRPPGRGRGN